MKLSGSNYGMPTLPIEAALAFHAELGFGAIEITVNPGYTTALESLDAGERRRLRQLLTKHGLVCSGVANFQNLAEPDAATAGAIMARHRAAVDLAAELTTDAWVPRVPFTSGGAVDRWPDVRDLLVERIGALAQHARSRGVTVTLKAHANGAVSRPYQLVDLFEQVGSEAFRFCFDMSHFEVQGLSIEQAMYPLLPLSEHVEVKASVGRAPQQEYMIPGEPDTQSDFTAQFRALRALGYRSYIVPEMSVHVQRRPNYDQYESLRLAHRALTDVLRDTDGRAQPPHRRE